MNMTVSKYHLHLNGGMARAGGGEAAGTCGGAATRHSWVEAAGWRGQVEWCGGVAGERRGGAGGGEATQRGRRRSGLRYARGRRVVMRRGEEGWRSGRRGRVAIFLHQ